MLGIYDDCAFATSFPFSNHFFATMKCNGFFSILLAGFALLSSAGISSAALSYVPPSELEGRSKWAYEAGYAYITSNKIEELLFGGKMDVDNGPDGGELYILTAARTLGELKWDTGSSVFHPQMELPLTLIVVDEHSRSPFLNYNFAYTMRWVDFPWNDKLKTTFSMGVGLSYSSKILLEDIKLHEGEERSNTKIYWPLELTFALPQYPKDCARLFIVHQSGGHIFDRGGINCVGFGYRRDY